ncbi:hypothetical protein PUNSTDRAFT_128376 [Punctularia strigosozonata HHB-11173 SS5]|uniref:Uncharacterized protein n=1 Tax=Punctularia strigosozonata (strain HHB-11173) TaxID=741275 RepID=R7S3C6_PUNST|nr:uncharacterized protein PUNSTDRAFT_128376 [Punctularia strigosozonata HHB-11173 SS5]EIN04287.1 hypothetical protein PUNSTDRAFT_128376 [Punctularia strigosozonata HHB-11173 SS5]
MVCLTLHGFLLVSLPTQYARRFDLIRRTRAIAPAVHPHRRLRCLAVWVLPAGYAASLKIAACKALEPHPLCEAWPPAAMIAPVAQIIPLGRFDATNPTNNIITNTGWLIDTVLDEGKLERAWSRLNAVWPILSARLKTNNLTGELEFHVPEQSALNSAYGFTTPTEVISCMPIDLPEHHYTHPSRCSHKALLNKDVPVAAIHVTRFDDATAIGLSISHALVDGGGRKKVMSAFLSILRGEEVAPLATHDAFITVFGFFHWVVFILATVWEWLRCPRGGYRVIYIPAKETARLKDQAMADIASECPGEEKAWVSTSDAVVAFILKCMFASERRHKPLGIAYMANVRKYLPSVIPPTYIRNANMVVPMSIADASSISSASLGSLALVVRRTLQSRIQPAAVDQYVQWRLARPNDMPMFTEPNGLWAAFTNWREMGYLHFDWSPAALNPGTRKAKCLYLHSFGHTRVKLRNSFIVGPDDPSGGIWVLGTLSEAQWEDQNGFGKYAR